jgi:hypothetical protein
MKTPYTPTYGDVGLHWPTDSQELTWDHHDGSRLSKGDGWRVIQYLRFVVEPEVIAACAIAPGCARLVEDMIDAARVTTSKFLIDYVMRPLSSGDTYAVHGNYHWDLTHNEFLRPMRAALVKARAFDWVNDHPAFRALLDLATFGQAFRRDPGYTPIAHQPHPDTSHLNDGDVDSTPKIPDPPLSEETCARADEAAEAHSAHARALLAHVTDAVLLSRLANDVRGTQSALEASARTPREQMLLGLFFTGGINPAHALAYVDACTRATMAAHDAWHDALGCEDQRPPDLLRVVHASLAHGRSHYLRCAPPGVKLRELCPAALEPQHGTRCKITDVP